MQSSPDLQPKYQGLSQTEVMVRRTQFGYNELSVRQGPNAILIFLSQFKSPLVYLILVAALISLLLGEIADFVIILAVVMINAVLGFTQEYNAQRTYLALQGLVQRQTSVIRAAVKQDIPVRELVPDDVVLLSIGDLVPCDGILLEAQKLSINEAILTGESEVIDKAPDREGATHVFMGTTVAMGRGVMQVLATGMQTELGKIAISLQDPIHTETPLQQRLRGLSQTLTKLVLALTLMVFVTGLWLGKPLFEMLRMSIVLAIAAVPEGLLIAVTVILVLGMRKILKSKGLVKKLVAVETLGAVNVICTDKTGTLTEGRMRVSRLQTQETPWGPKRAIEVMARCNNEEGPVELALTEYLRGKLGHEAEILATAPRLSEELFSSESKFMSVRVQTEPGLTDYLKGAPEIVLAMCEMAETERQVILQQIDAWAADGLRVIGLAYRDFMHTLVPIPLEQHSAYTWVGLVGIDDPIRKGVPEAIAQAQQAGIQVKMITGDYRRTAERVARAVGLNVAADQILDGQELSSLSDAQLQQRVAYCNVFSRICPHDKLRIVTALQAQGQVTAMIGDGVNDAPALRRADIGVVVDNATDVAKETADLILLDNNFRTIVAAIEEGRVIFTNICKVVAYVLSNSFAAMLTIFGALVLDWPMPLLVAQILWINLVIDGPIDIVLGFEPAEVGVMQQAPRAKTASILPPFNLGLVFLVGLSSMLGGLGLFGYYAFVENNITLARSMVFALFTLNSLIVIVSYRTLHRPLWRAQPIYKNLWLVGAELVALVLTAAAFAIPALSGVLQIQALSLLQWGIVLGVVLCLVMLVEIGKWVFTLRSGKAHKIEIPST